MGYYNGIKIPNRDPWWEEREGIADTEAFYNLGWEDGYQEGMEGSEEVERLEKENESLRALLEANVRVIKEEIKREMYEVKV